MPFQFRCNHCNRRLSIGRRKAGCTIECPRCNNSIQVPTTDLEVTNRNNDSNNGESLAPTNSLPIAGPISISQPVCRDISIAEPTVTRRKTSGIRLLLASSAGLAIATAILCLPDADRDRRARLTEAAKLRGISFATQPAIEVSPFAETIFVNDVPLFHDVVQPTVSLVQNSTSAQTDQATIEVTLERETKATEELVANPLEVNPIAASIQETTLASVGTCTPEELELNSSESGNSDLSNSVAGAIEVASSVPTVAESAPLTVKRKSDLDEEELRKKLMLVREITIEEPGLPAPTDIVEELIGSGAAVGMRRSVRGIILNRRPSIEAAFGALAINRTTHDHASLMLIASREDLDGLPLRLGQDCLSGIEVASNLNVLSQKLRVLLQKSIPSSPTIGTFSIKDNRPDPATLRSLMLGASEREEWLNQDAIPTLLQLLMAQDKRVRLVLVDALASISGKRSTEALAQRAIYDLNSEVRARALESLQKRNVEEFKQTLLDGLRYPLAYVAENAAEAVVALDIDSEVPALCAMLDEADPDKPFKQVSQHGEKMVVREVVRINHLANCLMCHAPSFKPSDLVRAAIPNRGQKLENLASATTTPFYSGCGFVRADVTYLRQDFSVLQPVEFPNEWPANQRFDYLIQTRTATPKDFQPTKRSELSDQKQSIVFALQELTGEKDRKSIQDWKEFAGIFNPPTEIKPNKSTKARRTRK